MSRIIANGQRSSTQAKGRPRSLTGRLVRAADVVKSAFYRLGLVLATNQITALLFCCVLICSLLAPAIILSFSPYGSLAADRDRGLLPWEMSAVRQQGLLASADEVCWDKLALYWNNRRARIVRVQPVLVSPGGRTTALRKTVLHKLMRVQNELVRRLSNGDVPGITCATDSSGNCLVSSPLSAWTSEAALLGDEDIHATLNRLPPSSSSPAVPAPLTVSLTGERRDRHGVVKDAKHLTFTFYVQDSADSLIFSGKTKPHAEIRPNEALQLAVKDAFSGHAWSSESEPLGQVQASQMPGKRIILKYLPNLRQPESSSTLENSIYLLAYITVGFYVYFTLRRLKRVHSKVGLVMTGIVEIFLTGAMSLSICWLFGLGLDLVPWKLIPFLVVVCGVDNLFAFTNAVCETDITLSVPERIAEGLSVVGLSSAVTLGIEMLFAGLVHHLVTIRVFRELVIFTIVAIIVDYCLELVFFTVILSIDIQRLELADFLRQGPSLLIPAGKKDGSKAGQQSTPSADSFFKYCVKYAIESIKAHKARTITFTILAAINILLFINYGSEHFLPAFCSEGALSGERAILGPSLPADFAGSLSRRGASKITADLPARAGAAAELWNALNPRNLSSVQLLVEAPIYATLFDSDAAAPESLSIARIDTPKSMIFLLAVLATAATTVALYFVLRYLLKDAELLSLRRAASQKHRDRREKALKANVSFDLIRRVGPHDVDLVASSGTMVATWSLLSDSVSLFVKHEDRVERIGRLGIPITAEPPSLVSLQLGGDGAFCAALTKKGRVFVWSIDQLLLLDFSINSNATLPAVGRPLYLFSTSSRMVSSPGIAPPSATGGAYSMAFCTVHTSGAVVAWDCHNCVAHLVRPGASPNSQLTESNTKLLLDESKIEQPVLLAPKSEDAFLAVLLRLPPKMDEQPLTLELPEERTSMTCASISRMPRFLDEGIVPGPSCRALTAGWKSGKVTITLADDDSQDDNTKTRTIADLGHPIRRVATARTDKVKCLSCSLTTPAGLFVVASTSESMEAFHVSFQASGQQCRCSFVSRTGDKAGSARRTPKRAPRLSASSPGLVPPYPLASHGARRPSGGGGGPELHLPTADPKQDDSSSKYLSPNVTPAKSNSSEANGSATGSAPSEGSNLVVRELYSGAWDVRGGWSILQDALVGVRRRTASDADRGDQNSAFSRWEAWSMPISKLLSGAQTEPGHAPVDMDVSGLPSGSIPSAQISRLAATTMIPSIRLRRSSSSFSAKKSAVQFALTDKVLPFTRPGVVASVLDRKAMAAAFGDSLLIISSHA